MNYGNYKSSKIRATAIFLVILIAVFTGCAQNMAAKKDMELSPEPKLITEISTSEDSESFNVLVKGNRMLTYMSVKQLFPLGVLLYFPETALDNINRNISPESEIIGPITASELTEKGHKSKIEISLKKDVPYKAANEGTGLKISFSKPSKTLSSSATEEKPEEQAVVEEDPAVVESKATEKYKKPAWVNRIDFSSEEAGKSTIIVGTTRPVEYRIKKASPKLLQLKLLNTRLPDYRRLPLVTTRFESAVDRIIPVQTPAMKNTSMLTIELRESVPYFIEQNEDLLLVHFEASSVAPRPLEDAELPSWKKVLTRTVTKEEVAIDEETPEGLVAEKYTGEKIALDFYETDVKNVFRILKEVSGKNFAVDKDVAGKVTLTLDKPVPWDQVLDLVLKMNQLGRIFEGDIIRIATAQTLKNEEVQYKDQLKADEEKKALEPLVTEYISVNYAAAQEDILPKIEAILTENRGSVSADKRTNIIIMTDVKTKIEKAREIVNRLDIPTRQVMIEARIVEATVGFAREIGIKWGGQYYETGTHDGGNATMSGRTFGAYAGGDYDAATNNFAVNLPGTNLFTAKGAGLGFTFGRIGGSVVDLDVRLMAMETNDKGKIISRPKITTLDNETAKIKQGYDYPFKTLNQETGITTIDWKPVDLLLEVTPHITSDNRVSMAIKTTKNDLQTVLGETTIATKEAETKLLVSDGETIVIGGIIKETQTWTESKVPFFGDIPILGWLFKSKYRTTEKSELLIFITPRIIRFEQQGNNTDYKY